MAFRILLLAFSGEAAFASSLSHAIKLAHHHDAWLTAIMRIGLSFPDRHGGGLPPVLRDRLRAVEEADLSAAQTQFETAIAEAGLSERARFITPDQLGTTLPSEVARHYDLVITGFVSDLAGEEHHVARADQLALNAGRPVLVVPQGYTAPALADHVLVAGDGTRAAARALGDAMDIIEGKRKVTILTVAPASEPENPDGGLLTHLSRHGIMATHLHRVPGSPRASGVAAVIEDVADEVGADEVGAFEHGKLSQDLFGGVTRDVLRTARAPVFISH